jgi:hypothetical protein
VAALLSIKGDVQVKHAAVDNWVVAKGRVDLFENDKVRTAKGGTALVQFHDGSAVNLQEDALVGIAQTLRKPGEDPTDLTLLRGSIDAQLDQPALQSISVSTPAATVRAGREIVFQ